QNSLLFDFSLATLSKIKQNSLYGPCFVLERPSTLPAGETSRLLLPALCSLDKGLGTIPPSVGSLR
ncbi:MAG: hypothetical protein ACI36V_03080, partial [Coriobacteriales bacterium]